MKAEKQICRYLRSIRRHIAEKYGLKYKPFECNNKSKCNGSCPSCDKELYDLQSQLDANGISKVEINKSFKDRILDFKQKQINKLVHSFRITTEGEPLLEEDSDMKKTMDDGKE